MMSVPKRTEKIDKQKPSQFTDEERDPDQAWFWTEEWQKGERKADEDLRAGRYKSFDTMDELLADLNNGDED